MMKAHEARALMNENRRRIIREAPLTKALALIEKSAKEGHPGVNMSFPSRPGHEDPLIGLSIDEEKMLAEELERLGYTTQRTEPTGNDQRDAGSFMVTWGDAMPPRGNPDDDHEPLERCPHCKQPWEGHDA